MTEYRHDFWHSSERKKARVTSYKPGAGRERPGKLPSKPKRTIIVDARQSAIARGFLHQDIGIGICYGRDSRFPASCWLMPAFLLALPFAVWIVNLLVRFYDIRSGAWGALLLKPSQSTPQMSQLPLSSRSPLCFRGELAWRVPGFLALGLVQLCHRLIRRTKRGKHSPYFAASSS
jgi:hypothetical protein